MVGMTLAELDFGQTVGAGALNALFTAVLVGGAAGLLIKWFEQKAAERRDKADQTAAERRAEEDRLHEEQIQNRQFEYQRRDALRETYAQLLIAQRRSRQASLELAKASVAPGQCIHEKAVSAHDEFINLYHRLNLDASAEMWRDARALRDILDDMLELGQERRAKECEELVKFARWARQNLERSFRLELKHETLQPRRDLGKYDKRKES
jgi:hypothetical protein